MEFQFFGQHPVFKPSKLLLDFYCEVSVVYLVYLTLVDLLYVCVLQNLSQYTSITTSND